MHTYLHIYSLTYIYTYIHTYIHTIKLFAYIHIYMFMSAIAGLTAGPIGLTFFEETLEYPRGNIG